MPGRTFTVGGSGHGQTRRAPPAYLTPNSIAAVRELAELMAMGEWAPTSYRDADGRYVVEKIVLGIMHGAAVGLGPFAAVHAIAVIDGQPTIWGDGALALVERSGLVEDMSEEYSLDGEEGLTAICTMRRRSWPTPITRRFSMAMAEAAGLTQKEGPWQTYRRRMLMMRARSWTLRDGFADVLRGLSIREEVEDYESIAPIPSQPAYANRSASPSHRSLMRPRFADYLSSQAATGAAKAGAPLAVEARARAAVARQGRAEVGAVSANTRSIGPLADEAAAVPWSHAGNAGPPATTEEGCVCDAKVTTTTGPCGSPSGEQNDKSVASREVDPDVEGRADELLASTAHGLIDAEGCLIEFDSLDGLREAFDRLFADPHLIEAQARGLWESNEIAREEIERAFGAEALADADLRRQSAERGVSRLRPAPISRPMNASRATNARRPRQHSATCKRDTCNRVQVLPLDPSYGHEELFQHYRSGLLRLKRQRADAATFVDFREANRSLEVRLREHLPDRVAEIDGLYRWAARHAR